MRLSHLTIAVFALFLATPLLLLAGFGVVEERGRPHPEFPPMSVLLRAKKHAPDQFGDAVLQRSMATGLAVQTKNWTSYHVVGFVDGPLIFSGKDGWLFYYEDFKGGRCIDETQAARGLRRLAATIDMARAGGVDVIMSVSPDKSAIYPEMLSDTWRAYWKCRPQNSATLRRLMKAEAPMIVDHAEPLLAEKARDPSIPLYYPQDSHWTVYGGEIALRHLLSVIHPEATLPRPKVIGVAATPRKIDMMAMLMIPTEVPRQMVDEAGDALRALNRDPSGLRTTLIHDSFYGQLVKRLTMVYPDLQTAHFARRKDRLGDATRNADRLIINLAERILLSEIERGVLTADAGIATALVDRNLARAAGCDGFSAPVEGGSPAASTIAIPAVGPGHLPCLRIAVRTSLPASLELTLPQPAGGAPVPGRSIRRALTAGQTVTSFVLPAYTAGAFVDLRLVGAESGGRIETLAIGALPSVP